MNLTAQLTGAAGTAVIAAGVAVLALLISLTVQLRSTRRRLRAAQGSHHEGKDGPMPDNLWVQEETLSRRDNGDRVGLGSSPIYQSDTADRGELFRSLVGEFGRCAGTVYREVPDGPDRATGWVFEVRRPFEDDPTQSSIIETWVTVHTAPPTISVTYHYADEAARSPE